jgi:hypothetical protein
MNLKILKLFTIAAFLAFAACAFLFPSGKIEAQSSENVKKRDEILEKFAAYKVWKQVQKPEKKPELTEPTTGSSGLTTDVLSISQSSIAG